MLGSLGDRLGHLADIVGRLGEMLGRFGDMSAERGATEAAGMGNSKGTQFGNGTGLHGALLRPKTTA